MIFYRDDILTGFKIQSFCVKLGSVRHADRILGFAADFFKYTAKPNRILGEALHGTRLLFSRVGTAFCNRQTSIDVSPTGLKDLQ